MGADEAFFQRLRRLRREEPRGAASARPQDADAALEREHLPVPDWLRRRLGRDAPAREVAAGTSSALPDALCEHATPAGPIAARVCQRSRDTLHGEVTLSEIAAVAPGAFARFARDTSLAAVDLERAVYLDIETTGLSGGAGTYAFLVALGRFTEHGFEVWQGFLRDPEEERALLQAAAERIAAASAIVSFFGKSFDRHRLEDKMRLHGVAPPFADRPHLDLYHPCSRLYRDAFADGRLATLERALCGVRRRDDLPGSYAPAAWFDYLAGRAHRLEAVFAHNLDDVLSLVALAAHVGRASEGTRANGEPLAGPAGLRALGLARLAAERGERAEALQWLDRALELLEAGRRAARAMRADLLRLSGEREEASNEYRALADEAHDEHAVHALLELAKDAEHRRRDPAEAADLCARARIVLERSCTGRAYARHKRELEKREARLRAKL